MWQQFVRESLKIARSWNHQSKFFLQRLEIFFGGLLAMKANVVMNWLWIGGGALGLAKVGLRFSNPFPR
jgi:hypothetical protein